MDNIEEIQENTPIINNDQPKKLPQYIAALSATLAALAAGTVLGWTSPILTEFKTGQFHNITVDANEIGWVGSLVTVGAMMICIPTGVVCNYIGAKNSLLVVTIPYSLGWLLIIFSDNVLMLYFGRLFNGMACGACCVAAPLYCSEISSKNIRGTLGSYFQLMITLGILLAYVTGKFFESTLYTIVCTTIPLIFFVTFVFQPETPTYCIKKGLHERALKSLKRLRGDNYDCQPELLEIEHSIKESTEVTISYSRIYRKRAFVKGFIIACALMFFQQFSGVNAIILYTTDIFTSSGVKIDSNTAAILVGFFQSLATFVASLVIDKSGRKILLLLSSGIMAVANAGLAFYFTLKYRTNVDSTVLSFIPVLCLCIFIIMFSIGLGPIPWVLCSELFTTEVKSIASSIAITFNWFLAFLITKFYLQVKDMIGEDTTFYFFSFACVLGTFFTYFVIPETKGKTIEQIQEELEN